MYVILSYRNTSNKEVTKLINTDNVTHVTTNMKTDWTTIHFNGGHNTTVRKTVEELLPIFSEN